MGFRYPQPNNEDDFELFCLRLLRNAKNCPHLQQNGKRGERQHGVDLIDLGGTNPFLGAQCKHHEPTKTLPPAEIKAEVTKALGYDPPLDEFHILTTARKSGQAQSTVIKINQQHQAEGKFIVVLWHWEEIEQCLDGLDDTSKDKVIHADTGRSVENLQAVIPPLFQLAMTALGPGSQSAIDSELDEVKAELEKFHLEVAQHKLDRLEAHHGDRLTKRQRFRLVTFRGNISITKGEWQKAGELLLKAKTCQPEDELAKCNEALGYELVGNPSRAHELAATLIAESPSLAKAAAIWVRTAPPEIPFAQIESRVTGLASTDETLLLSLAYRALSQGELDAAVRYAEMGKNMKPDAAQAWFVLAQVGHEIGRKKGICDAGRRELLQAESHYEKAITLAEAQGARELEAAAHLNRGILRAFLDDPKAEADYRSAIDLSPQDASIHYCYAGYLIETKRYSEAIEEAEIASKIKPFPEAVFFAATARFERNSGDDKERAIDALLGLVETPDAKRRADAVQLALEALIEKGRWKECEDMLTRSGLERDLPAVFFTLSGRLQLARGNTEATGALAVRARESLSQEPHPVELQILSQLFIQLGCDQDALPLLERCVRPGRFDLLTRRLLDCANRLKRHDVVLRVCRGLREAGEEDRRLLETEVDLQQFYNPQEAIRLLVEFLKHHPDDRIERLRLTVLGLHFDRQDLVAADPKGFPSPQEVDVHTGLLAIHALRSTNQGEAALRYSYQLLRNNFDSVEAHSVYIAHVLMGRGHEGLLQGPDNVKSGMAVCYTEEGEQDEHWIIIEEEDKEKLSDERSPDDPLAKELLGKKVGDQFVLAPGSIQNRMGLIKAISSKYAFRHQDCLKQFQIRFPNTSFIQLMRLGKDGEFDPSPLFRGLDQRRTQVEHVERLYREKPMPIWLFADIAGRDIVESLAHLTGNPKLGVRCCAGTPGQLREAAEVFQNATALVLDIVTLMTLGRLEMLNVLSSSKRKYIVSQATYDLIRNLVAEGEEGRSGSHAMAAGRDGGYSFVEVPPELKERRAALLRSVRDAVRDSCKVQTCPRLAEMQPGRRDQAVEVIGRHGLETIGLAEEAVLWTDDFCIALLGSTEFKAKQVWTQLVLHEVVREGVISQDDFNRASAKLLGWHYHFTWLNPPIILAAGELANWDPDCWPLAAALDQLGEPSIDGPTRIRVAAETIRSVWAGSLSPLRQQTFLFGLLRRMRSISLITALQNSMPAFFGANVISGADVISAIEIWLRESRSILTH